MKIAIMGSGGVGGYLGGKLAVAGNDVTFIARGRHLEAMRAQGLRIRGVESFDLPEVKATDRPSEIGQVDMILFAVKLRDTDSAARAILPIVRSNTTVLTLQNGIDNIRRIGDVLGEDHLLSGAAFFPASISAPGEITYHGRIEARPHIVFGEPHGGGSDRVTSLLKLFNDADIMAEGCPDTDLLMWQKFLLVAGTSAATTLTRSNFGVVRSDPDLRWLLKEAIAEAERVGRAAGIDFEAGILENTLAAIDTNPAEGKSSQLFDLENGRPLELDGLSGAIVRFGRELNVPTPVHSTVYAALKPFKDGRS